MASPAAGAKSKLSERGGAGIVLDKGRDAESLRHRCSEYEVTKAGDVGSQDHLALVRVDQACRGDAGAHWPRAHQAGAVRQQIDNSNDGLLRGASIRRLHIEAA